MMPKIFKTAVLLSVLGLLLSPIMTQAATFKSEENLIVNEETEDLYAAGTNVTMMKPVLGDLFLAGNSVTINPGATVAGDLNVAGGQLWLNGPVGDDARLAGGSVAFNGKTGDDLLAVGGTVFITGEVKGDIYAAGSTVTIGGIVGGNVVARGGEVILTETADIKGDLGYTSETPATIDSGAQIGGYTTFHQITKPQKNWEQTGAYSFIGLAGLAGIAAPLIFVLVLVAIFLFTLLVIFVAPLKTQDTTQNFITHPWKSLGFGLAYLVAMPIIGFILLVIPFTFMIGAVILIGYLLSVCLLPAVLTFFIGSSIFRLLHKQADFTKRAHLVWAALLGAVIYSLIMFIPLLGGLLIGIGMIFAAGALVMVLRPLGFKKREWNKTAPPVPTSK